MTSSKIDYSELAKYISDGLLVSGKIRRCSKERRGFYANNYSLGKEDNSLSHYFLGKTQYDYRTFLGETFNKSQALGDLMTFTQDANQRFEAIVNKPAGESCPPNTSLGERSNTYKLRDYYRSALALIEKLEAEPDEGLVEEDHSSEARGEVEGEGIANDEKREAEVEKELEKSPDSPVTSILLLFFRQRRREK